MGVFIGSVATWAITPVYAESSKTTVRQHVSVESNSESEVRNSLHIAQTVNGTPLPTIHKEEVTRTSDRKTTTTPRMSPKLENIDQIKTELIARIDKVIEHLKAIKEKSGTSKRLEGTPAAAAATSLDQIIAQMEALKIQVNAATTIDELRAINKQLQTTWQRGQRVRQENVGLILANRFLAFIDRLGLNEDSLSKKLDELEGKGVDVSSIREELASYEVALAAAKAKVQQAVVLFEAIPDSGDQTKFNQGMTLLQEAKKELFDAGKSLQAAIRAAINANKDKGEPTPQP